VLFSVVKVAYNQDNWPI